MRLDIGDDIDQGQISLRQLRERIKEPDAFHFFVKEFDTIRPFVSEREDIDDSAADRKLTRLIDKVDADETDIDQERE